MLCGRDERLKALVSKLIRGKNRFLTPLILERERVYEERRGASWTSDESGEASCSDSPLGGGSDASNSSICVSL